MDQEEKKFKKEMLSKVPEWAQLFLAVLMLGGGMLATYVANEVSREAMNSKLVQHTEDIALLKSETKDIPILIEKVTQLHSQNERQIIVFERLASSVETLSTNVARLDERMRAIERNQ